ncbi:MAG: phosphate signaling complex protein PhoU [Planctomycetes bacterium]|mgnify:CR=1 FL=1|nr:phosphate signaling complex protein PhoU [Planctomycetota bacterium]MCB9909883.1 phosphate signaling complex protein PhoU [Planctomycetota bacterium]MCB9913377.1 phosphate signaling complex protein PhoU [Planctomycetota bacterium]HPF13059.1 phosphate signaling complex protein PhoU [Planctomycetota bacterium]HRV79898.1 phosphate signaling complex protein PhoU [Planctomycetota bacterium]
MTKHLHTDLQSLERNLLALGTRVEEAVRRSITALSLRRTDMAEEVIGGDRSIDMAEVALEEECLKVLALHQPVAGDLRFVAACMKITNDLERIGDLAVNISKRAKALCDHRMQDLPQQLVEMTERTAAMLRSALDAFVREDGTRARQVMREDDRIDKLHKECLDGLIEQMKQDPETISTSMLFISISRHLERIADHTTNIAEDVIYLADGDIVRHQRGF